MGTVFVDGRRQANVREGLARVVTGSIEFATRGDADVVRVTDDVREALRQTGLRDGTVTVFAPGATGAVTTIEYEPGVVQDLQRVLDEIASPAAYWQHNVNNGAIPFVDGRLTLGRWQEIVFIDLDERPRERRLVVQVMGV